MTELEQAAEDLRHAIESRKLARAAALEADKLRDCAWNTYRISERMEGHAENRLLRVIDPTRPASLSY